MVESDALPWWARWYAAIYGAVSNFFEPLRGGDPRRDCVLIGVLLSWLMLGMTFVIIVVRMKLYLLVPAGWRDAATVLFIAGWFAAWALFSVAAVRIADK